MNEGGSVHTATTAIPNSKSEKSRKKFIGFPAGWKNPGPPLLVGQGGFSLKVKSLATKRRR
jgi:hypothetical protein